MGPASGQLHAANSLDHASGGGGGAQALTPRPQHSFPLQQGVPSLDTSATSGNPVQQLQHGAPPLSMHSFGGSPTGAAQVSTHPPGLSLGPITAGWGAGSARASNPATAATSAVANAAGADQMAAAVAALTLTDGAKPLRTDVAADAADAGAGGSLGGSVTGGDDSALTGAALAQQQLGEKAVMDQRDRKCQEVREHPVNTGAAAAQGEVAAGCAEGGQQQSIEQLLSAAAGANCQAKGDASAEPDHNSSSKALRQALRGRQVKAMSAGGAGADSGSDGDQGQSTLILCDRSSSCSHGSPSLSSLAADSGGEGDGEGREGGNDSGGSSSSPSRLVNHHHHRSSGSSATAAGTEAPSSDESPTEEEGEGKPSRHLWLGNIPLRPNKAAMELLFR